MHPSAGGNGNSRICGTCHRVEHNLTIDADFIATLDPSDPPSGTSCFAAITQHATLTLDREPGVDFRVPTEEEEDLALAFQLSLGRLNELDLTQVNLFDPDANDGRQAFMDPQRGRCNFCHANAGGNSEVTGLNKNFDTGTRLAQLFVVGSFPDGAPMFDGGFGGRIFEEPVQVFNDPPIFGLGNVCSPHDVHRVKRTWMGGEMARVTLPWRSRAGVKRVRRAQRAAALPKP